MNRSGVAYTLVCVILLFAVGGLFYSQNARTGHESHEIVSERVRTMDNFIKDLEQDSQRAAYIAGFRTFISMEQQIISVGTFFPDADVVFKEIFLTGNYSGTQYHDFLARTVAIGMLDLLQYFANRDVWIARKRLAK